MVASWAGTSGWASASFFGDTPAAAPVQQQSSCNQQQTSTINDLANNNNLQETNAPIGSPVENVEIGDVMESPEPGTWVMMIGGLAIIGYARKRRKRSV